jgi:acyl-CoA synthetase (AMP-forming)/AMP-acid ligase II
LRLGDIPRRNAFRYPNGIAIETEAAAVTWSAFNVRINRFAAGLLELGLRKGDRIAVLGASSIEVAQTYFAAAKIGAVIVPIPLGLVGREVAFMLDDVGARAIVATADMALRFADAIAAVSSLDYRIAIGDAAGFTEFASVWSGDGGEPSASVEEGDLFAIRFTSGTTGLPKGVPSTHGDWLTRSRNFLLHIPHTHEDRAILASPISLGMGSSLMMSYAYVGAHLVLRPRLDPPAFLQTIASHGLTTFMLPVPSHFTALLDDPAFGTADLSSLRVIGYGGAVFPVPLLERMIATFPCDIFGIYGALESGGFTTYLLPEDHRLNGTSGPEREARVRRLRSCGREGLHADVRVIDESGRPKPAGEVGEMIIRTDGMIRDYWNRPGEIEKSLRDGWFHTGDGAWIDEDRYIFMSDRIKDVVRSGGMNISAVEVEEVLLDDPAVAEASVIGLAHPHWTEALVAVVVLRPSVSSDEDTLIARCKTVLANYKVPKRIVFAASLPKNSMDKVVKRELRDTYAHLSADIPAAKERTKEKR